MYKVLVHFKDLKDDRYSYNPGDMFPRKGLEVSAERIEELSGSSNGLGMPLIEKISEPVEPKREPEIKEPEKPVKKEVEKKEPEKKVLKKPARKGRKNSAD